MTNSNENNSSDLISIEEVCRLVGGVTKATVYKMINRGDLPRPIKILSSSRWLRGEIAASIQRLADQRETAA